MRKAEVTETHMLSGPRMQEVQDREVGWKAKTVHFSRLVPKCEQS